MGLVHSIPNKINSCFLDWAKGTNQHIPWDIAMGNNQNGKMDSKQHTDGKQHPQHLIRAILYFIVFYWMYVCVCIYIYSNVYQLTGGTSLICAHRHIEQTCKYDQICSNDRSIGKSHIKLVTSMYVLRPPRFLCKIPKFTGKTAIVIL